MFIHITEGAYSFMRAIKSLHICLVISILVFITLNTFSLFDWGRCEVASGRDRVDARAGKVCQDGTNIQPIDHSDEPWWMKPPPAKIYKPGEYLPNSCEVCHAREDVDNWNATGTIKSAAHNAHVTLGDKEICFMCHERVPVTTEPERETSQKPPQTF